MRASLKHKAIFQSASELGVIAPLQRPEGWRPLILEPGERLQGQAEGLIL